MDFFDVYFQVLDRAVQVLLLCLKLLCEVFLHTDVGCLLSFIETVHNALKLYDTDCDNLSLHTLLKHFFPLGLLGGQLFRGLVLHLPNV